MSFGDYGLLAEYKKQEKSDHGKKVPSELIYVTPDDTFYAVVEKMANLHIHRVYVVDKTHRPIRVITQADVLREVLGK